MNTKNLSMLVILSAAMLTGLIATAMSHTQIAFADKLKCEDNDNNNCNTNKDHFVQKLYQKNDCKNEDETKDDSSSSNSNEVSCTNYGLNQEKSGFCPLIDLDTAVTGGADDSNCPVTNTNNGP